MEPIAVSISNLSPKHIGKVVTVKGFVVRKIANWFILQSCLRNGCLPQRIHCINDSLEIDVNQYVAVTGSFEVTKGGPRISVGSPVIRVTSYDIIAQEEADVRLIQQSTSWFREENLRDMTFNSMEEAFDFLNAAAMGEGFKLTRKKALSEQNIRFRCHESCKYGKKAELNHDCEFSISVQRTKDGTCHVTRHCLEHNHYLSPWMFIHLIAGDDVKRMARAMMISGTEVSKVIVAIKDLFGVTFTSAQIRSMAGLGSRRERKLCESEELATYMNSIGGRCLCLERRDADGLIHRQAVMTFTLDELRNLEDYGDFVALDPTFTPTSSNWSLIPLTVVGPERNLLSAGVVFAASCKTPVFLWILQTLIQLIPQKLKTICSDDDVALEAAWNELTENDDAHALTAGINRVICWWHKIQNFNKWIVTQKLPGDVTNEMKMAFRSLGLSRCRKTAEEALSKLRSVASVRSYIEKNIQSKLRMCCKAFLPDDCFTLGYITSSISESSNNAIKKLAGTRFLTLMDLRKVVTEVSEQRQERLDHIKHRKPHKVRDHLVNDLMGAHRLSRVVAEAIAGSITKGNTLTVSRNGPKYYLKEKKRIGEIEWTETFSVIGLKCTCRKQAHAGLPCSHQLRVLKEKRMDFDPNLISPRWVLNDLQFERTLSQHEESLKDRSLLPNASRSASTPQGRYISLKAQINVIASLGSKTKAGFEIAIQKLKELEDDLMTSTTPVTVVDDQGIRSGRAPSRRKGR